MVKFFQIPDVPPFSDSNRNFLGKTAQKPTKLLFFIQNAVGEKK